MLALTLAISLEPMFGAGAAGTLTPATLSSLSDIMSYSLTGSPVLGNSETVDVGAVEVVYLTPHKLVSRT